MTLRELKEKRASRHAERQKLAADSVTAGGEFSENQEQRWNELTAEVEKLDAAINRQELIDAADRRADGQAITGDVREFRQGAANYNLGKATTEFLHDRLSGLEAEFHQELSSRPGNARPYGAYRKVFP